MNLYPGLPSWIVIAEFRALLECSRYLGLFSWLLSFPGMSQHQPLAGTEHTGAERMLDRRSGKRGDIGQRKAGKNWIKDAGGGAVQP